MILRFASGSFSPASADRSDLLPVREQYSDQSDRQTYQNLLCFVETQQAVVDEYASRFLPIARCSSIAVTEESTPPRGRGSLYRRLPARGYGLQHRDNFRWRPQGFTLADITHKTPSMRIPWRV